MHCLWFEPISNSIADKLAAERARVFVINWILDPIVFGRYPAEMKKILGSTLPEFSTNDMEKLKKGLDFIGMNHYTGYYVEDCILSVCEPGLGTSRTEGYAGWRPDKDGVPIGEVSGVDWMHVYPQGMEKIVTYIKERYNKIPMFITENGYGQVNKTNVAIEEKIEYMSSYLDALLTAMKKGADVRGHFAWSLLDNFERTSGYTRRFVLYHVDFITVKRTPKQSAAWFKEFLGKKQLSRMGIASM